MTSYIKHGMIMKFILFLLVAWTHYIIIFLSSLHLLHSMHAMVECVVIMEHSHVAVLELCSTVPSQEKVYVGIPIDDSAICKRSMQNYENNVQRIPKAGLHEY